MTQQIEVRLTVFQDEDPELYAWLMSLPASRGRRRAAYRQVMKDGLFMAMADPAVRQSFALPQSAAITSPRPVEVAPVAVPAVAPKDPPEPENSPLVSLQLNQDDLAEIFGPR